MYRHTFIFLATAFIASCVARVPANFAPEPRRLAVTTIDTDDHSGDDEIVTLVFGDAGTGSDDQFEVGRRMAEVCQLADCDLALMLGDNFYNRGVNAPKNGEWDLAFDHKFEKPYAGLGRLDMWAGLVITTGTKGADPSILKSPIASAPTAGGCWLTTMLSPICQSGSASTGSTP